MIKRLLYGLGVMVAALILMTAPVHASTQDFTITSFTADYYVSRASDNVSEMRVKEKIIAQFPTEYDQNHGILRALPQVYNGHSLELAVQSVKDQNGTDWRYESYTENDNLVLKIGDPNTYVRGQQEYDIEYTMRGVANVPTASQIFWNVNGTQWQQPFGEVIAQVHIPANLAASVQQGTSCFTGMQGSTEASCLVAAHDEGDGKVITIASARELLPGETLSFNIPFANNTFAPYTMSQGRLMSIVLWSLAEVIPSIVALFIVIRAWRHHGRDPKGKGVIVPQYTPPKEVSVLGASHVYKQGFAPGAISATIIDMAVRHYIKIYETGKKPFGGGYKYDLELVKAPTDLRAEENAVLDMIFGGKATPGKRVSLDELSKTLYKQAQKVGSDVEDAMTKAGYFTVNPSKARLPYFIVGGIVAVAGVVFPPYTLGLLPAGIICLIAGVFMAAPTVKGAELKEYMLGMRDYMKLAEAERLKVLQSPHGDLTLKIDVANKGQLIKLYERLLPYAMLFGIEKDWARQFADLYDRPPEWYAGTGTFNAIYFASAMSGLDTATTASFSPPSSGGAGAGGGGGGGGGGGW